MKIRCLLAVTCVAVAGNSWAVSNPNKAAEEACACLEAPYAKATEMMGLITQAMATGDMTPIMAMQEEMMALADTSAECFDDLKKKYPDIDRSDQLKSEVKHIADQLCPNPLKGMASMMGGGMPYGGPQ